PAPAIPAPSLHDALPICDRGRGRTARPMTGFTVALIGPDGAGKTTVSRRIEQSLPVPVKYIYMGVNTDASNVMLPTTRAIHALKDRKSTRLNSSHDQISY